VDGEELAGAKQNRVLTTSILVKQVTTPLLSILTADATRVFKVENRAQRHGTYQRNQGTIRAQAAAALALAQDASAAAPTIQTDPSNQDTPQGQ
jgi:hypothetical protein